MIHMPQSAYEPSFWKEIITIGGPPNGQGIWSQEWDIWPLPDWEEKPRELRKMHFWLQIR
jgi:hypothetical protein